MISPSPTLAAQIQSAATAYDVPLSRMYSILDVENQSLDPNAVSSTGVVGLVQVTQDTWNTINPGVPYSLDTQAQLNTMAKILAPYNGDSDAIAAAAYNGGSGVANTALQLTNANPSLSEADAIQMAAVAYNPSSPARVSEITGYVTKVTGQSASNIQSQVTTFMGVGDPSETLPVSGDGVADPTQLDNQINTSLIITTGLDETPWFDDDQILDVSSATLPDNTYPVVFKMFFSSNDYLPIEIKLMASISSYSKSMRHVVTKTQAITGVHVDFWGMETDSITGQGSTGLMANQLGITDYVSLSEPNDEATRLLQAGLERAREKDASTILDVFTGSEAMRVAARDAFVEFLALFKNNSTVWFRNETYTGVTTSQDQSGPNAWSPHNGASTFQAASRRNSVMTRGNVIMYFRDVAYYGFFKSLSFSMDASSPNQWKFNFTFTVEKTVLNVGLPQ